MLIKYWNTQTKNCGEKKQFFQSPTRRIRACALWACLTGMQGRPLALDQRPGHRKLRARRRTLGCSCNRRGGLLWVPSTHTSLHTHAHTHTHTHTTDIYHTQHTDTNTRTHARTHARKHPSRRAYLFLEDSDQLLQRSQMYIKHEFTVAVKFAQKKIKSAKTILYSNDSSK